MTKTAQEIRQIIKDAYPNVRHIQTWALDKDYEVPTLAELLAVLEERSNSPAVQKMWQTMKDNPDRYDCDDYTLQLHAMIRARRPRWPFGGATGDLKEMVVRVHDRCICITQEGLKTIEATDISFPVFDADPNDYELFYSRV